MGGCNCNNCGCYSETKNNIGVLTYDIEQAKTVINGLIYDVFDIDRIDDRNGELRIELMDGTVFCWINPVRLDAPINLHRVYVTQELRDNKDVFQYIHAWMLPPAEINII